MKRSEMLDIIKNTIDYHSNCCNTEEIADIILKKIETKGMLPPAYEYKGIFAENTTEYVTMTYYVDGLPDWEEE